MELYREVGSSFRAEHRPPPVSSPQQNNVSEVETLHMEGQNIERKLKQKIRRLKKENKRGAIQMRQQNKILEHHRRLAEQILEGGSPSILHGL